MLLAGALQVLRAFEGVFVEHLLVGQSLLGLAQSVFEGEVVPEINLYLGSVLDLVGLQYFVESSDFPQALSQLPLLLCQQAPQLPVFLKELIPFASDLLQPHFLFAR